MAEIDNSLIYEVLKSVRDDTTTIKTDLSTVKIDVRSIKGHMASFMTNEVAQDTTIASILDRLERIERRLELGEQ